jgi:hypothetical protein
MQRSNKELREATLLTETVREHLSIVGATLPDVPEPRLPAPERAAGVEPKAVPSLTEAKRAQRVLTEAKRAQRVQRPSESYETELHMPDQGIGR